LIYEKRKHGERKKGKKERRKEGKKDKGIKEIKRD
jgi:hypothetical protein